LEVNEDLLLDATKETTMTNLDPQTTADFWDAYLCTAAGSNLAQVNRTLPGAPLELGCPVGVPVSSGPGISSAAIKFAWDLVLMPGPIAA
jgi:hypothetical protein